MVEGGIVADTERSEVNPILALRHKDLHHIVTVFLDLSNRQPKNKLRFTEIIVGFSQNTRYNK